MSEEAAQGLGGSPSTQLFRLVLVVGNHVRTRMDARLAPIGLTTQQAAALTIIGQGDGGDQGRPPTLGSIARQMGCSHQNVRQLVTALERKGLVTVAVDPTDRRARRVATTASVAELFGPRDDDDHSEAARWFDVLSTDEQVQAVSLLGRVLRHLVDEG